MFFISYNKTAVIACQAWKKRLTSFSIKKKKKRKRNKYRKRHKDGKKTYDNIFLVVFATFFRQVFALRS